MLINDGCHQVHLTAAEGGEPQPPRGGAMLELSDMGGGGGGTTVTTDTGVSPSLLSSGSSSSDEEAGRRVHTGREGEGEEGKTVRGGARIVCV